MNRLPVKPKHIGILVGLFILVVLVMDFNQRLEGLNRLSTQVATVRVEGTAVLQTQNALITEIAYATSDKAAEDYARGIGMARTGENPIQPVPAGTPTPTPVPAPPLPSPQLENWQIWLGLFFGN
jgi:hypothetical protein